MPLGGRRKGAGRPKGIHTKHKSTVDKAALRAVLQGEVAKEWTPMIQAQIKHAKGINYLVYRQKKGGKFTKVTAANAEALFKLAEAGREDGGVIVEVWEKEPSTQAFADLANRTIDKPAETLLATLEGALTIELESRLKAGRDRLAKAKRGDGKPRA